MHPDAVSGASLNITDLDRVAVPVKSAKDDVLASTVIVVLNSLDL